MRPAISAALLLFIQAASAQAASIADAESPESCSEGCLAVRGIAGEDSSNAPASDKPALKPFSVHNLPSSDNCFSWGFGSGPSGAALLSFSRPGFAPPDEVHGPTYGPINSTRLWLVSATMFAGNAAIMWYYFTTFYSPRESQRSKWHTFNDWYNADLNVDKIGHIWGTQAYANTLYHILRWTNMREEPAMWWSSGLAFFFQLQMEMTDAFYKAWGWSWWDVGANAIGAAYPNLQRAWPPLRSVSIKMSYWPSRLILDRWVNYVLKDYDGFTYWLAFTVEDFLPKKLKPWWPDWLGIAVGYGAANTVIGKNRYNTDRNNKGLGYQEWYIALDYDLRRLPGDTPFLKFLKEQLNLIHFPSPAIRFTPSTIYYGLFF